jgi:hypothetical protein
MINIATINPFNEGGSAFMHRDGRSFLNAAYRKKWGEIGWVSQDRKT